MSATYQHLRVEIDGGVATATIDNPPVNLLDVGLIGDLHQFGKDVEANDEVRVVVLDSANPDWFIAHADVALILQLPKEPHAVERLPFFSAMTERFRTMPKATIAVIEGRAGGGGSELALACDMRFAAIGRAVLSQPEVALGIIPGGTGTQRLGRLAGRARALEIILGCDEFGAEEAEHYGWVNRALPADELRPFVHRLAHRIAGFPAEAIAQAKAAVDAAAPPMLDGLLAEAHAFNQALVTDDAQARMRRFLERGGQTPEVEAALGDAVGRLQA
jgi:enoyl-CoA hydratase/carnithine racemase